MHSCDNRRCVRPDHLSAGTVADNNRDMTQKGRGRPGRREGAQRCGSCCKLGHNRRTCAGGGQ